MIIIRLEVKSSSVLQQFGISELIKGIKSLELVNAYQYDRNNFFSLQRIEFTQNIPTQIDLENYIKGHFNASFLNIIGKTDKEIYCIMKQKQSNGYFPYIESGPWAFLFPITVTQDIILLNVIADESYTKKLFETMTKSKIEFKIISIKKLNFTSTGIGFQHILNPYPNFSLRQKEIATYAALHGYFSSPKKISSKKIAEHFKISETAVNKRLKDAKNIAMKYFFGGNI